tara:strand:- start:18159 stop:18719 length:561 start_codon:yes stop_codon:yes gene_type:complete
MSSGQFITIELKGKGLFFDAMKGIVRGVNEPKDLVKEVIRPAAKIVAKVMRQKTPVLKSGVFNVYRTPKLSGKMKAPKGMGVIYAAIAAGTLKKSVGIFTTPASKKARALNVGPRYKRGVWKKPTKGGWFMHFVQFGTDSVAPQPFVLPALLASRSGAGNLMKKNMGKLLARVVTKNGKGVITYGK